MTNVEYRLFVALTGHDPSACADSIGFNASRQPVVGVGWFDARDYWAWVGKQLCSEAEWEQGTWPGRLKPKWQGKEIGFRCCRDVSE